MIFLIGMPGAGKTFWGKEIAHIKNIPFIDLDEYIETREQKTIAQFFTDHDEKAFREIENAFLVDIIENAKGPMVVACGGGTPCYKDNMALIKQNGIVVYLKADVSFLLGRLKGYIDNRPLLSGQDDIEEKLQELLNDRSPVYEQADHILQADYISQVTFEQILKDV